VINVVPPADPVKTWRMPLKLAVIGAAHSHVNYALDELDHRDDVELVAIADPELATARLYSEPHGVPAYGDHRAMLERERPDVVMIAGIYSQRAEAIVDALRSGADVLADKPLCTTLSELESIEGAQRETGHVVALLLEKRNYPATVAARQLLAEGMLGELVQVASTGPHRLIRPARPGWFLDRTTYGGILGDLAVHDIDLVLWLSGATEGTVSGLSDGPGFALYGSLLLKAGPVVATIEVNWLTPAASPYHGDYRMRLTGTEGTAELYWAQGRLVAATSERPPWEIELPARQRPAVDAFDALVAGREPVCGTAAAFAATRVALLAQQSADAGGSVLPWTC
jgi:predicted dehydrogenase